MLDSFLGFCMGLVIGCIVGGLSILLFLLKPQDSETIKVSLKNILPSDEFASVEWLYFHMELSPKDMPVLRHVLELCTEEGTIETVTKKSGYPTYKRKINMVA